MLSPSPLRRPLPLVVALLLLSLLPQPSGAQRDIACLPYACDCQFVGEHAPRNKWECCSWLTGRVNCNDRNELTSLNLTSLNLRSNLPSFSDLPPSLERLDLSDNSFTGSIPEGLASLSNLQYLNLSWNHLDGHFPDQQNQESNLDRLESLDLSHNDFTGLDLDTICRWKNLKDLNVSNNRLAISLDNLTECRGLQKLDLSSNQLRVDLPQLPNELVELRLRSNIINKTTLREIQNLYNLTILDLGNTSLSGTIPFLLNKLTQLRELFLDHNSLDNGLGDAISLLKPLKKANDTDASSNGVSRKTMMVSSDSSPSSSTAGASGIAQPPDNILLTSLDVSNNSFTGGIPTSLKNCTYLVSLQLQHNHFNGTIPDFFWNLTRLKLLNLSYNNLTGAVPTGGIFDNASAFVVEGNPELCGGNSLLKLRPCPPTYPLAPSPGNQTESEPKGTKISKLKILIVIIPVAGIIFFLLLFWVIYRNTCFANKSSRDGLSHIPLLRAWTSVTYASLQSATNEFSSANLIGSGGIGSVYRGTLEHDKGEVAVKVLDKEIVGDSKSFNEGCSNMKGVKHRNLAKILTSCENGDDDGRRFRALVYEFMPNGSLEMWLHGEVSLGGESFKKWNLSSYQRLNIAIDVASALVHLHCGFQKPILHCNLKPSNVLIADDMSAQLTDLGMNRFFAMDVVVAQSKGYVAPEHARRSSPSPMWDVYSFGVLLLEMYTRKRPTDDDLIDDLSLHKYVLQRYSINIEDIVDPLLIAEETCGKLSEKLRECIMSIIQIALICSNESPEDRMEMKEALEKLEQAKFSLLDVGGNGVSPLRTLNRVGSSVAILV